MNEIQERRKMTSTFHAVRGGAAKLNTGFYIPLVGLGTYKVTGAQVKPAVDAALGCGYRMFDTAKYYVNEPELGAALAELLPKHGLSRSDIFLTTKFFPDRDDPAAAARHLVKESLGNLRTDYIDMVLIHYPKASSSDEQDEKNPLHRKLTYLELEKMKDEGKIRSVGVSNYESRHIEEIKSYGKMMPCANQVEYHPHFTRDELKEYCKKEGVFFQAFSSLARHEPALVNDPVVVDLAKTHNTSVPIVLLSFALSQGVGIVPKSTNPQRIKDNLEVTNFHLNEDEIESLHKLDRNQHYIRCYGMTGSSGVEGSHKLRTGYRIPLVGLGTYKIKGDLMKPAVDAALSAGYRLFDTAKVYDNESDLGDALETCLPLHNLKREDVFLLTKIYPSDTIEDIVNMVDDSLRNLRTSHIDLVLIHFPKTKDAALNDPDNALHRKITYLSLENLKKEGKIRSVGVSNYEVRHMEEIKAYGQDMPCMNQVEFHPHFVRQELMDYCKNNDIFLQAYSSLARHNPDLIEHSSVLELAAKYKISPQIVLLSWAVSQGVGVIPKSSHPQRILDNLKACEIVLEKAEIQRLRDLDRNKNYVRCEGWLVA
ncbi:oxidoreductase, aldo/keto reductase family protein [Teladorsagia circumcincta]|uniref:Oxidoreductase, aldo/keto reductase family protein n=1 Tax=Teladorsagia circumcincta TaxID=45464 RepID=A0A2G9UBX7_TELCI|nr:oxidoreductase, aldo/keto reductase family protein [Teladorsagia circumcincta]